MSENAAEEPRAAEPDAALDTHDSAGEAQRRILNRLKRARGQLNAVIESVENGENCRTVVSQLSAVTGALDKAGFAIISSAMRECVGESAGARAADADPITVDELEKLFLSLA